MPIMSNSRVGGGDGMDPCELVQPGPACSQPHPPAKAGSVPTHRLGVWLVAHAGRWLLALGGSRCHVPMI